MKCQKCGKIVEAGYKFCTNCGAFLSTETEKKESTREQSQSYTAPENDKTATSSQNNTIAKTEKAGSFNRKYLIIIGIIGAIAATMLTAFLLHKPTINLNKYIESNVELSGYEGAGTVMASIDYDAVIYDYADKIKLGKQAASELNEGWGYAKDTFFIYGLQGCVDGQFDKNTELSNGDTVTYQWNIKKSALKNFEKTFNCKLKYKDFTYKVTGLEELPSVDPFDEDYFSITFSGTAPNGEATVSNSRYTNINYSVSPFDGLSNGDKVTVTASLPVFNNPEFVLTETEKTYEAKDLDAYVTDVSQISDEYIQKLDQQAKDEIDSESSENIRWNRPATKSREYVGAYLATSKGSTYNDNELFMIYKLTANNGTSDIEYYFYVNFHDVIQYSDGSFYTDLTNYDVPENEWINSNESFTSGAYNFAGYETLDKLYDQKIAALKASYTITDTMNQ